jgi:hypothetical protein
MENGKESDVMEIDRETKRMEFAAEIRRRDFFVSTEW